MSYGEKKEKEKRKKLKKNWEWEQTKQFGGNQKRKRKKREKGRKEKKLRRNENETSAVEESGGKFPPLLNNSMKENPKKKGERKRERKGRRRKTKGERKNGEEKEKNFLAFQRSKLYGPRIKVCPHNESFAWVPKSGSFIKLQDVGNFPTRVIYNIKAIYWHERSSRP